MTKFTVVAAVVEVEGRVLLTRRLRGTHLEGLWEFPGGKCDPGETMSEALRRELREELAIDADVGEEILATTHEYADRLVELHFFDCRLTGVPAPQLGQEMRWTAIDDLASLDLPPADATLVRRLSERARTAARSQPPGPHQR